jgi:anti-anti-sigma factor
MVEGLSLPVCDGVCLAVDVVESAPGTVVVTARGEIDTRGALALEQALETVWARLARRVVLDLRSVTSLNIAGLGVLLDARRTARDTSVLLRVRSRRGQVGRLLELAGLGDQTLSATDGVAPAAGPVPRSGHLAVVPDLPPADGADRRERGLVPAPGGGRAQLVPVSDAPASADPVFLVLWWIVAGGAAPDLDGTLHAITAAAVSYLGADGAVLSLHTPARRAESDRAGPRRAGALHELERRVGQGPGRQSEQDQHDVLAADLAFDVLVTASRDSNTKLVELARQLAETGEP